MKTLAAVLLVLLALHSAVDAKTDAEKSAERARKEQEKAEKNAPAQVLVVGSTMKQIQGALVRELSGTNWIPRDINDFAATFEKSQGLLNSAIAGAIVGTPYGGNPTAKHRITFAFFEDAGGIRVVNAAADYVVNEGMHTEFHDDQRKKLKPQVQAVLERVRIACEPAPATTVGNSSRLSVAPLAVAPADSIVRDTTLHH